MPNFVIVRKGYGPISFNEPVNLTGISSLSSLQEIVKINQGSVSVYSNESEPVPSDTGLNIPAQVSLINLFPLSGIEPQFYKKQLQRSNESSVDTEMGGFDYLSRLSKAKHIFERLAKFYLDKRQPPAKMK